MTIAENEQVDSAQSQPAGSLLDSLREGLADAIQVAEASFALIRSELRLARVSAITIIWLSFGLIILGAASWLTTLAAVVAGIYQATGNIFIAVASVAVGNLVGVVWVIFAMRRCWRDLSLPRTRALMVSPSSGSAVNKLPSNPGDPS